MRALRGTWELGGELFVLEKEPTNEAVRSKLTELAAEAETIRKNGEGAARHER
jgi:hypothetical protein